MYGLSRRILKYWSRVSCTTFATCYLALSMMNRIGLCSVNPGMINCSFPFSCGLNGPKTPLYLPIREVFLVSRCDWVRFDMNPMKSCPLVPLSKSWKASTPRLEMATMAVVFWIFWGIYRIAGLPFFAHPYFLPWLLRLNPTSSMNMMCCFRWFSSWW